MKNEGLELNLSENREGELLMIKENETDNPVLAICYDFDKTLSPDDMQAQGYIQSIDYEVDDFWRESNELSEKMRWTEILLICI